MPAQLIDAIEYDGVFDNVLRRSVSDINERIADYNERFSDVASRYDGNDEVSTVLQMIRSARDGLQQSILDADQAARRDVEEMKSAGDEIIRAMRALEMRTRDRWGV